jgi:hypothetical protein
MRACSFGTAFAGDHRDRLLVVIFGALGMYLTIDGILQLLSRV